MDFPISAELLKDSGFRNIGQPSGNEHLPSHYRLAIAHKKAYGSGVFLEAPEDLCIEVCKNDIKPDGMWFCWIVKVEPRCHIHVRFIKTMREIARLYCGLVDTYCSCDYPKVWHPNGIPCHRPGCLVVYSPEA